MDVTLHVADTTAKVCELCSGAISLWLRAKGGGGITLMFADREEFNVWREQLAECKPDREGYKAVSAS